jgi:hypothetical protein
MPSVRKEKPASERSAIEERGGRGRRRRRRRRGRRREGKVVAAEAE